LGPLKVKEAGNSNTPGSPHYQIYFPVVAAQPKILLDNLPILN
jgi:hypothetical protein